MKCKEIIAKIEETYPKERAESWDNPGLLVGDEEQEVKNVFLALDVTDETLEAAVQAGADLMITHHPLIFSGMKQVTAQDFIGRRVIKLIQNNISYYAMHTNFDVLGMAELSADYLKLSEREILEVTYQGETTEGLGRVGMLPKTMTLRDCAAFVKQQLNLPFVKVYGNPDEQVRKAAVCTGSGKSLIKEVIKNKAQVYITGDVDYHSAIDAVAQGVNIIDAGHYGTEYIFMDHMKRELAKWLPGLETETIQIVHPCEVF
nr:Nif3-like dinuclear metal center hexameric protein [uncultured Blautia sp.]